MRKFGIVLFVFALATPVGLKGRPAIVDAYSFSTRIYGKPAAGIGYEQRRKIRSTLFVPNSLPALESESYGQFEAAPGVVAERVSYATGYGLRVPAIVYRPKNVPSGKMPAIVVV